MITRAEAQAEGLEIDRKLIEIEGSLIKMASCAPLADLLEILEAQIARVKAAVREKVAP